MASLDRPACPSKGNLQQVSFRYLHCDAVSVMVTSDLTTSAATVVLW